MYCRPTRSCLSECLDDDSYGMPQDLVSLCIGLVWAVIGDDALLRNETWSAHWFICSVPDDKMVLVSCRSNLLLPNAGSECRSHFVIH